MAYVLPHRPHEALSGEILYVHDASELELYLDMYLCLDQEKYHELETAAFSINNGYLGTVRYMAFEIETEQVLCAVECTDTPNYPEGKVMFRVQDSCITVPPGMFDALKHNHQAVRTADLTLIKSAVTPLYK